MADTRYRWRPYRDESIEAYESRAAKELKRRTFKRRLDKDPGIRCLIRRCGKPCRVGELCYYPTANVGPDNKTLAHVECVDDFCSAFSTQTKREAKESKIKEQASKGILPVASPIDVLAQLKRIRQATYTKGFEAGRRAAYAELAAALGEDMTDELGH